MDRYGKISGMFLIGGIALLAVGLIGTSGVSPLYDPWKEPDVQNIGTIRVGETYSKRFTVYSCDVVVTCNNWDAVRKFWFNQTFTNDGPDGIDDVNTESHTLHIGGRGTRHFRIKFIPDKPAKNVEFTVRAENWEVREPKETKLVAEFTDWPTPNIGGDVSLYPSDDAMVKWHSYGTIEKASKNYGSSETLYIRGGNPKYAGTQYNRAFLKFDTSSIDSNIDSAHLAMWAYDAVNVDKGDSDTQLREAGSDWKEKEITWNNQPSIGSSLGSRFPSSVSGDPSTGKWVSWNVTSVFEKTEGLSFGLKCLNEGGGGDTGWDPHGFKYTSKEYFKQHPLLILDLALDVGMEVSSTELNVGDNVTLSAFSNVSEGVDYEWSFGDGASRYGEETVTHSYSSEGSYVVSVSASDSEDTDTATATITVSRTENYLYTSSIDGSGSIDPSSGSYNKGTELSITATPDSGWKFSNWEGDIDGPSNPKSVTINSETHVKAIFVQKTPDTYTIDASCEPIEGGSIKLSKSQPYEPNESVTVDVVAKEGYKFTSWSGDVSESQKYSQSIDLMMDSDKVITANFEKVEEEDGEPYGFLYKHNYSFLIGGIIFIIVGISIYIYNRVENR